LARFLHEAAGRATDETAALLSEGSENLARRIVDDVTQQYAHEASMQAMVDELREKFTEVRETFVDEFRHGMLGDSPLAKDPIVRVFSNVSNSPGAVVQTGGVGNLHQTVSQHIAQFNAAMEGLTSSPEFTGLDPADQQAVKDVADIIREELTKPTPDQSKVRRWGERLVGLAKEFGLHVAAGGLVHWVGTLM